MLLDNIWRGMGHNFEKETSTLLYHLNFKQLNVLYNEKYLFKIKNNENLKESKKEKQIW